jgi:hypothetical protein
MFLDTAVLFGLEFFQLRFKQSLHGSEKLVDTIVSSYLGDVTRRMGIVKLF